MDVKALGADVERHLFLDVPENNPASNHTLVVPFKVQRANRGALVLKPDRPEHDPFDLPPVQLRNLIRGMILYAGIGLNPIQ